LLSVGSNTDQSTPFVEQQTFVRHSDDFDRTAHMPFLIGVPARTATIFVAACLVAAHSWGSPSPAHGEEPSISTDTPTTSDGSCEELAARQASAYLDRLRAKEYAAASEIATHTADACLDAGDLKQARMWFQTARALGGRRSNGAATQDAHWRRRYEEAVARLRPRENDVAMAEKRMTARTQVGRGANQAKVAPSTASKTASADPPVSLIATAGGIGVFVLSAVVLLGRKLQRGWHWQSWIR
jgi:hypothetical protein